jgi:hypothetical protein
MQPLPSGMMIGFANARILTMVNKKQCCVRTLINVIVPNRKLSIIGGAMNVVDGIINMIEVVDGWS